MTVAVERLLTEHLDTWTAAVETKSAAGRGSSKKLNLVGIKKLRELILELAVRGQLVPQDENDEPAEILLERIAAERERLVKEKKIKKPKKLPEISEDEKPFDLPVGWGWARVGTVSFHNAGKTLDRGRNSGELREYITTSNLYWGKFELSELKKMPIKDEELEKCQATKGDLLICEGGEAGRAAVWTNDEDICFQNHIHRVRLIDDVNAFYVYRYFEKMNFSGEINQHRKGVGISNMSGKALSLIILPIPPLNEQKRIVAKVDELMALCDALEQEQESSIAAHALLVENLLAALTNAANQGEFKQAWARVAAHFDTLFTTEQSVEQLKQTILQLAVMGKLVEQDPADEPAGVLLERIAAEKARLVKEKKIKKQKVLPEISEEEKVFELPEGWAWCRFGSLVNVKAELVRPEGYQELDQIGPDLIEKGTGLLLSRRTVRESGIKGPNSRFYKGQILYSKIRPSLSKAIIAEFDGLCSADMYPLQSLVDPHYLLKIILSETFLEQVRSAENRIKMPKLNIDSLSNIVIPICPESEQLRIAEKLDQLMVMCEQLKAKIANSQESQLMIASTLTESAVV